jgi:hypothetical protein
VLEPGETSPAVAEAVPQAVEANVPADAEEPAVDDGPAAPRSAGERSPRPRPAPAAPSKPPPSAPTAGAPGPAPAAAQPAPAPVPAEKPAEKAAGADPAALLGDARKAQLRRQYGEAYRLARQSYELDASADALKVMGAAACKLKDASKAKGVRDKLPASQREDLQAACAAEGVEL